MTIRKRFAVLAGGVSLAILAGQAAVEIRARGEIEAAAAAVEAGGARVTRGTVAVDALSGRITLSGFAVDDRSGARVEVGRVTLPGVWSLVTPAYAAGDVTLEDVTVEFGNQTYQVKSLTVSGTSSSREEIAALFDKSAPASLSDRLRRLSAASITSPEMVMRQKQGDVTSSVLYRDVRIEDVKDGVAARFSTSNGAFASQGGEDNLAATFGKVSASAIDMVQIARIYGEAAGAAPEELKTIYSDFAIEGITGRAGKGSTFGIGRLAGKDVKARPSKQPWTAMVKEWAGKHDIDKLPPQERARFVNSIADMFDSFSIGLMEATDITGEDTTDAKSAKVKVARIAFEGTGGGKPAAFRVEGVDVQAKDGKVRIGEIAHTGWSYEPTLKALRDTLGNPSMETSELQNSARRFMPKLGTLTFRGVDLDVPDEKARAANPAAPNIKFGVKQFEIATGEEFEGVPTAVSLKVDNLAMTVPPDSKEDGLKDLVAMGYSAIDVSAVLDGRWNKDTSDFVISSLGAQGVNMGSVNVKGTFGNVSSEVFSEDQAAAQVALLGATVKGLSIALENKGLFEKLIEREAKKQGKSAGQMRKELGAAAQIGIPMFLGGGAQAKQVAAAVAKFLLKPNRLTVDAKAKSVEGLGVADFMAAQNDPQALLEAVDLSARAE
jgi:hypothetical protein